MKPYVPTIPQIDRSRNMIASVHRRAVLAGGAAMVVATALPPMAMSQDIPTSPEPGAIRLGSSPWIGGGPWEIAKKKGLFAALGLDDVEIVNFTADTDMNAAMAAGHLEAGVLATHTAIAFLQAGLPVKVVMLMDISTTADAIISDGSVTDIKGLKGMNVAYEEGSTSDILLNYALAQNGMTIDDIVKVPMPAADAGAAVIAGQVPVAVTYEPYLSLAMKQNPNVFHVFDAATAPGLISDVLAVTETFAKEKPGQVMALIKAWNAGLADYLADTTGGRTIIAEAVGATLDDLNTAFDGVQYYSLADNARELHGDFAAKVMPAVQVAAQQSGMLSEAVDLSKLIDTQFVDAAAK
jgi:NitT/TauT family transport system substrate-binding protein